MRLLLFTAASLFAASALAAAQTLQGAKDIPAHGRAVVLFDGKDLSAFDTYVNPEPVFTPAKNRGVTLMNGPNPVFSVEGGLIHVTGTQFGFLLTKKPFADYYLRAEFKWGVATNPPREGKARDSGILFNIPEGEDELKIWPRSLEFQICEGGTGDFWLTDGASLTGSDGTRSTGPPNRAVKIARFGEGPWTNVVGFRDPVGEVESPYGEWNLLELVNDGKTVSQYVNGKLVNRGTDPDPASGKLLLQSEGAEVYFRNVVLYPLKGK
jgi:hypothetical protein